MSRYYSFLVQNTPPTPYVFDTDFKANVIDIADANGYAKPSNTRLIVLDNLMRGLKDEGLEAIGDSFVFKALNSTSLYMFGRIDWFRNNVIYSAGGTVIATVNGEEGNGSNGYLGTGFNPTVGTNNYIQNSATRLATLYKAWTIMPYVDGITGSTNNRLQNANAQSSRINSNSNLPSAFDFSGTGTIGMVRTSSTSVTCYNKATSEVKASTSAAMTNAEQRLFNSSTSFSDAGISAYYLGGAITGTQYTAYRALLNTALDGFGLSQFA